jgi:hypothetical protein
MKYETQGCRSRDGSGWAGCEFSKAPRDAKNSARIGRSSRRVVSARSLGGPERAFGDAPRKHGNEPVRRLRRLEKNVLSSCPIPQQSA